MERQQINAIDRNLSCSKEMLCFQNLLGVGITVRRLIGGVEEREDRINLLTNNKSGRRVGTFVESSRNFG